MRCIRKGGETLSILTSLGDVLTACISWIGQVVTSIVDSSGSLNDLLGLMLIGMAISLVFVGVKAVRSISWGA